MLQRRSLVFIAAGLPQGPVAHARAPAGLWFDPTQLPSYSGRLERWVSTPSGSVDRGLFREGTQFIFPASEAEVLIQAIEPGGPICVWGIRARGAPVVLMLAWARSDTEAANFVERPAWFPVREVGRERLQLQGRIQTLLLTPQGEGMGVILTDGATIRLPVEVHRRLGDALAVGGSFAADGMGTRRGALVAIDADRLGDESVTFGALPPSLAAP